MTLTNLSKTPFPWFGGKADAAPQVWAALGDPAHYVEPFAGSLAVLMRRPHPCNRTYYSETVNDFDGLLVNAWRSIQMSPEATADAASWPVSEADLHARHLQLLRWREERQLEHLMADPLWHDPVMAGWWMWGQSCWIGGGFCDGQGAWVIGDDGRICRRADKEAQGVTRKLPHVGNDGKGVNTAAVREPGVTRKIPYVSGDGQGVSHPGTREPGVARQLPHVGNDGQGVNTAATREPGVTRQLPHLGNDGQGVNTAAVREPGVTRKLPHVGNDGRGVNTAAVREPGVTRKLPHVGDNGQGVCHANTREPGVTRKIPFLSADGKGVNHAGTREPGVGPNPYHPMTMPELTRWMQFLSARLRHVRILNGDWSRACGTGALYTLPVRQGGGVCGVFLDPPYADTADRANVYAAEDLQVAHAVREWALGIGGDPRIRIVMAGYDGEHGEAFAAAGWREVEWYRGGFLKGGYGNQAKDGNQQARERLWLSPHCLDPAKPPAQASLL